MPPIQSTTKKDFLSIVYWVCLFSTFLFSCTVGQKIPVEYPKNTAFVYKYKVSVVDDSISKEEKFNLESGLVNQLDDSIAIRTAAKVFYKNKKRFHFFPKLLKHPPVYNSINADKSLLLMKALMTSQGYFYSISDYHTDTVFHKPDEHRVSISFNVKPGKLTKLDSISYSINKPLRYLSQNELQTLADSTKKESLITKGSPFAKTIIGAELDRIVTLYQSNGYIRFNRDMMVGLWDTLDVALLNPTVDPLGETQILQALQNRKLAPTADLEITLRPNLDSAKMKKYYVGNVNIRHVGTVGAKTNTVMIDTGLYVHQSPYKFKPHIFSPYIYLKHAVLYSSRREQRTLNKLNSIGAWGTANIQPVFRPRQDTVDFDIQLPTIDKYAITHNIEGSQNLNTISGNLVGVSENISLLNRNFGKSANQSSLNERFGIEFGNKFIQSYQLSLGYNIYFPRAVLPFKKKIPARILDNIQRTVFAFNADNIERQNLYNRSTLNVSWGYEFMRSRPGSNEASNISIKIPNIEFSYLKPRDSLNNLIVRNPSLKNIFTDGLVSSMAAAGTWAKNGSISQRVYVINLELSGFVSGLIPSKLLDTQLYRFAKASVEYIKLLKLNKRSSFALRSFAGLGYALNSTVNPEKRRNLPFFKEFFAGGPNSMRAWRLRRLGPGSTIKSFDLAPERYGDLQLELNFEYRFRLATSSIAKIESALYADIGNVWFLKKSASNIPEEIFKLSRLGKDIAIGVGTGVRLDFDYLLVRLDYAFKAKDPSPHSNAANAQNKWFYNWKLFNGVLQIGIGYPFRL